MKRIVLCLLCVLMIVNMAACGAGNGNDTNQEGTTVEIMQKEDPGEDDILNILMIGNSFCYYYVDELCGMLEAAGIKANVCNVYYSGCVLGTHWKWWKNNESNYEYFTTNAEGRKRVEGANLEYCLSQQNWDYISLQTPSGIRDKSLAETLDENKTYQTDLWNYIQQQYPQSKHLWHQTWSDQVGCDRNGHKTASREQQKVYAQKVRDYAVEICKQFNLSRVNTGEAWEIVRDGGYDNLCARLAVNGGEGDYYHDGDIGGGQYLNACVWFEALTGQSCIGNTYRPGNYELDEELINTLQQAAHQAVAALK